MPTMVARSAVMITAMICDGDAFPCGTSLLCLLPLACERLIALDWTPPRRLSCVAISCAICRHITLRLARLMPSGIYDTMCNFVWRSLPQAHSASSSLALPSGRLAIVSWHAGIAWLAWYQSPASERESWCHQPIRVFRCERAERPVVADYAWSAHRVWRSHPIPPSA